MTSRVTPFVRFAGVLMLALVLTACGGNAGGGATSSGAAQPTSAPAAPPKPTTAPPAAGQATNAPAAAPTGAQKSSKDTLTIVFQANQGSLDPHFAATNQEMIIIRNIYNALLKYKPDSTELTGDLATSWDASPDGLTYTFKLRQDVEW